MMNILQKLNLILAFAAVLFPFTLSAQQKICYQGAVIKTPTETTAFVFDFEEITEPHFLRFSTRPLVNPYQYLVTDTNDVIVFVNPSNTIDISVLMPGAYRVWSFSYIGEILAAPGQHIQEAPLAAYCSGLSKNFISIVIEKEDNGPTEGEESEVIISFGSILEAIRQINLLQILERGIETAELEGNLSGEGPFTIFAPINNAFAHLAPDVLQALFSDPDGALRRTLQNHILAGSFDIAELMDGQELVTLSGQTIRVTINEDGTFIGNAKIIQSNIVTNNGILHLIMDLVQTVEQ